MSVLSMEALGIDAIFVVALVAAMACLAYLVVLTLRERRELRPRTDRLHEDVQGLRPGVAPSRRAERVTLRDTRG